MVHIIKYPKFKVGEAVEYKHEIANVSRLGHSKNVIWIEMLVHKRELSKV